MPNNLALTGYEQRIINNLPKSESDKITDKKIVQETVKEIFNTAVEQKYGDSIKSVPIGTILITKKIAYDLENPKDIDLMAYSKLLGEQVDKKEVSFKTADDLFGDIVVDEVKN